MHRARLIRVLVATAMILLLGSIAPSFAATEVFDCSTSEGWIALDASLHPATDAKISAAEGRISFEYPRDTLHFLAHHNVQLRGFSKLVMRVRSQQDLLFGVVLRDRDQARFYAMLDLAANEWATLEFSPVDFDLTETSPVEKPRLDPALAEGGYVVMDIGSFMGFASGRNTIEIDSVEVTWDEDPAGN